MGTSFSSDVEYNSTEAAAASNLHTIFNVMKNATIEDEIPSGAIPIDVLIAANAEWKYSHSKAFTILRSTSGITSVISSSIFIWMIMRSHDRLSTTQHRLLLGLCVSDILSSLSWSTFNAMLPSDNDYRTWNARGNQAASTVHGFILTLGMFGGLFYNASLNIYFLAVVKYKKSDEFIRAKIEPFLHLLPIAVAISLNIQSLVENNHVYGLWQPFDLPQCEGYDAGNILRDGFEIPCHGYNYQISYTAFISRMILMFIPAVIMMVSLGMVYCAVRTQEKKLSKYGIGALRSNLQQQSISTPQQHTVQSQSRAVMHKAFGYTFAWFLSYGIWLIDRMILASPLASAYAVSIFFPLQGLFNLLIFMHPKIMAAKKSKRGGATVSWCKAFSTAFWSKGKGGRNRASSRSNLRGRTSNRPLRNTRNENTASSSVQFPMFGGIKKKTNRRRNKTRQEEEEKCEIQVPDNLNPNMTRAMYSAACPVIYERNIVPSSSAETTTAPTANLSAGIDDMVGVKKADFAENVNVGHALSDIAECSMESEDEEEGMSEANIENKEIVPMALGADVDDQKETSMEDEDEEKGISADVEEEMIEAEIGNKDVVPMAVADVKEISTEGE